MSSARPRVQAWPDRCALDEQLSRVATRLWQQPEPWGGGQLRSALQSEGAVVMSPLAIRLSSASRSDLGRAFARMPVGVGLRCGLAARGGEQLWVVDLDGGALAPLHGPNPVIRGDVTPPFEAPSLVILTGELEFVRFAVSVEALGEGIAWPIPSAVPAQVQLLARGPLGLQPVALRQWAPGLLQVHQRLRPLELHTDEPLAGALNRLRLGTGRAALRRHRLLRRAAMRHARAVCLRGRAAHELSPGADPSARLRAEGVNATRTGEVIARSSDLPSAFNALLGSPSHLMAMLEQGFTDAGVASARRTDGGVCLVMVLARYPRLRLTSPTE